DVGETCDPGVGIGECTSEGAAPAIDCSSDPNGPLCAEPGICVECLTDADCEDGESCTIDTCVSGVCSQTVLTSGPCDDGDACTLNDVCSPAGVCTGVPRDCDDNNPCTADSCVAGACINSPLPAGTSCNPADPCFIQGTCDNGTCIPDPSPIGCIDVELRTPATPLHVGDVLDVELHLLNQCIFPAEEVTGVQVVVSWDPTKLAPADPALTGEPNPEDPCVECHICVGGDNAGQFCFDDGDCPPAGVGSCQPGVPATNCQPGQPCCDDGTTCDFDCGRLDRYNWQVSTYRLDDGTAEDALNADCGPATFCDPYTGVPFNDGNLMYTALQQLICNGQAAPSATVRAGADGLWATTLKFVALEATAGLSSGTQVVVERCIGQTRTQVFGPEGENTGALIPSAPVVIQCQTNADCPAGLPCVNGQCINCPSPASVTAAGPRYLEVTPADFPTDVALYVTGADPDVSCVSGYVQADGTLGPSPVYLPAFGANGWGTVPVRGEGLLSARTYNVQADCDPTAPGTSLSPPVSATLWEWADTDHTGVPIDIVDAVHILDAFRGTFHTLPCASDQDCVNVLPFKTCDLSVGKCLWNTVESTDLKSASDCLPDRSLDVTVDVLLALDAFRNQPPPCVSPCP
ncbi:MAG: hypothetical protein D6788_08620, partial [Planctomycetota bacterium]